MVDRLIRRECEKTPAFGRRRGIEGFHGDGRARRRIRV